MIVEQRVYFMIKSDELDPGQITQYVGVEPTRSEAKESRLGRKSGRLIPPRHEWALDSGLAETTSLDEQVEAVMNQLAGVWDRIGELTAGGAEATLVMFRSFEPGEGPRPRGLYLDEEAISCLNRAGADLWIDEYGFS
ncbi:DUF4279 domain-containing protein [Nonomuraea solani]|uniref:DUF4279 domain-containing protein n=1 Tax=Nonomuraea solani TaxID=1144553 RepID=UPI000CDED032|nr:DUF4279 domain-containing protein [Nonomuraea solani]